MFKSFSVASLNVRGLKNSGKREAIFATLRPFHIIFLQETHTTPQDELVYAREWHGKSFWNHNDSRTAGTAILFSDNFSPKILQEIKDEYGQTIILILELETVPLVFCNVHAPSGGINKTSRKEFFDDLENTLKDLNYVNFIIGGDFNCVLDENLDRNNPSTNNSDSSKKSLSHGRVFTHRTTLGTASRIDRLNTPRDFRHSILFSDITPCAHSDHDLISANFNFEPVDLGKGTWHLNCSLFLDETYKDHIRTLWSKWREQKPKFSHVTLWWDEGKEKIKSFSRTYSMKKHREITGELKDRKKKLCNAQRKANLTGDACHVRLASEL